MAITDGSRQFMYDEEIAAGGGISEQVGKKIASGMNFLNDTTLMTVEFGCGGRYSEYTSYPMNDLGPSEFFYRDYEIVNIQVQSETAGTSGTTEIDLKVREDGSDDWTSIFSTTPKFTSSSADKSITDTLGTWATGTGITPPEIADGKQLLNAKCEMRFDLISAMAGASDLRVKVFYRAR